jgi:hypothetical protein
MVTVALNEQKNGDRVRHMLDASHLVDSVKFGLDSWLVFSPRGPEFVQRLLYPALREGEQILITNVVEPYSGFLSPALIDWITARSPQSRGSWLFQFANVDTSAAEVHH